MRELVLVAAMLAVASAAAADPAGGDFERTLNLPGSAMDVRLRYGSTAPGGTSLAGEGSIGTNLPGDGRLTVTVPHSLGPHAALGDTQLTAGYPIVPETDLLPKVALVAELALPTAPGSPRVARPGVKAAAAKQIHWGVVHDLHAETELRTEGRELARSYRTAVGANLHLLKATTASVDLVTLRPSARSLLPRSDHAELGLCHELTPGTHLRLGLGAGVIAGQSSLRSTLGLDLRF